jgi:PKD repeat protein
MKNSTPVLPTLVAIFLLSIPVHVDAAVLFNEVAWMGTGQSQYCEWIELYNNGAGAVDLGGAGIYADGGTSLVIKLSQKIPAGGYGLVERITTTCPDPVVGISNDIGSFAGGGLSNSGEYLILKDSSGGMLDSLDARSGWPSGDNSSAKNTMQRAAFGWITAAPTPGAVNATQGISSDSETSQATTTKSSADDTVDVELTSNTSASAVSDIRIAPDFNVFIGRERLTSVGSPISFEAKNQGTVPVSLSYNWSFGDGSSQIGKKVSKTYSYPGTYVVVLNANGENGSALARTTVRVVPLAVDVVGSVQDSNVQIFNHSPYEMNLGSWNLSMGVQTFAFPVDTILLPNSTVIVSQKVTRMTLYSSSTPVLISPDNSISLSGTMVSSDVSSSADLSYVSASVDMLFLKLSQLMETVRNLRTDLAKKNS